MPRHRHREFLRFLKLIDTQTPAHLALHLIVDNYAAHKTEAVKRWLKRHKRFHLHFIPTSASWLNMVERFFAEITQKRIRRGVFKSVAELESAIMTYGYSYWSAPDLSICSDKSRKKILILARSFAVLHRNPDDLVTSAIRAVPGPMFGCESVANLPVAFAGGVIGTVNMLDGPGHYAPERVAKIERLAPFAAVALLAARPSLAKDL